MKLNIANPATGAQKKLEIDDENRLRVFMDKRMAEEISGDALGEEFKGYVFKIMGGNDKEGFPMRQGVLVNKRVKLLLRRGMPCYKAKRKGERRRKSVRGCIVGPDLAVLSLIVVKRGEQDLPGLTDVEVPKRLGPKRVDKIKKMFNLTKDDDPRDYVVRRHVKTKTGNHITKKPKIQRLITPTILHRRKSLKKRVENRKKASYEKRKAFFEKMTKQQQTVNQAKTKAQDAIKGVDSKKKGSKKQSQTKTGGAAKKPQETKQQETKQQEAKQQEAKPDTKQPEKKQQGGAKKQQQGGAKKQQGGAKKQQQGGGAKKQQGGAKKGGK